MSKRKPSARERKGRDLERLVALLEKFLGPKEAKIASPDRLPDLDTGELREVDVSIRLAAGSAEILVIAECRDRRARQDVTWLEQLAEKRRSVGADKVLAVSSSPFGKPAVAKARRLGIDLRQLDELTQEVLEAWLLVHGDAYAHEGEVLGASFQASFKGGTKEFREALSRKLATVSSGGLEDKILRWKPTGEMHSVVSIWKSIQRSDVGWELFQKVPENGTKVRRHLQIPFPIARERYLLDVGTAEVAVLRLKIVVDLWKRRQSIQFERGRLYHAEGKDFVRRGEYRFGSSLLCVHRDAAGRFFITAEHGAAASEAADVPFSGTFTLMNPGP